MTDLIGQLIMDLLEKGPETGTSLTDAYQKNKTYAVDKPSYSTQLSPDEEKQFRVWVQKNQIPFNPDSIITDYDMRGFFRGLNTGDPQASRAVDPNDNKLHFPDKWKTPYHETFSRDSMYATSDAPTWVGDKLVAKDGTVLFDDTQTGTK